MSNSSSALFLQMYKSLSQNTFRDISAWAAQMRRWKSAKGRNTNT